MGMNSSSRQRYLQKSVECGIMDEVNIGKKGGHVMKIQGIRKSTMIGVAILLLTLLQIDISHGARGYETTNFRVGRNAMVPSGETVTEALIAAGANVEVAGDMKEGLKAFGANVAIPGEVQGNLIVFGANVVLSGKYHGKVRGAAANLILSGTFDDNVEVGGAKITITPTTMIKGDLIYSAALLEQQKGSQIMGKVARKALRLREREVEQWWGKGKKVIASVGFFFWILSLPAFLIAGILIHYAFPKKTDAIVTTISASPWKSTGVGFVFLVVVPVGIIISLLTVVGIPAAIIAGLLYAIFLYISRIYVAVWIGRKLLGFIKKSLGTSFFWPFLLGTILITLVCLIPIVGWLFRLFLLLISLGAMWRVIWRSILLENEKPNQGTAV
jgi:cytoskeletal protein CcmA (bactofilin family)